MNTTQLGELATVTYDGATLKLEQSEGQLKHTVLLEPTDVMELLHFIDDQAQLRALYIEGLRRKGRESLSPEWRFNYLYGVWQYFRGPAWVEIAPRPLYCDRGRWAATCMGVGDLNGADGFPMYFQDLERAQLEMQAWLDHRMRDYEHTEINQALDLRNRLSELERSIAHLESHLTAEELHALVQQFYSIQERLAPAGHP